MNGGLTGPLALAHLGDRLPRPRLRLACFRDSMPPEHVIGGRVTHLPPF
jgi:hypothetical protein